MKKMKNKKINITLLMGGPSSEREVSLATGRVILNALDKTKYNLTPVTINKDGKWLLPPPDRKFLSGDENKEEKSLVALETGNAINKLKTERGADVVFIAMHGTYGEDGTVQGFLEMAGVPYTGSGILASALAMDKLKSSELFLFHGLKVPKYLNFSNKQWNKDKDKITTKVSEKISLPCVIKPSNCGSSVGITIVRKIDDLENAVQLAFSYDDIVLAQEYISGVEVTCAVLDEGGDKEPIALPPTQIIPKDSEFFDYHAKYTPGATEEITPPRLPAEIINKIQENALQVHKIIGCSGMSRTDMILGGDGKLYVLEINTIPGMTETSLLPQAAAAAGISFPDLLDKIIQAALNKRKSL
ncbi:TPA: D-alanine--D-alanine ligase [Candidatus Azambacteria bacterium]|nr:D-alanine--D-alanine ligase [Candidatus Azambacteria bacterium]HCB36212.1 D-alanine--D-alanine ligase [Candidatus Azambacteria bacterium]